MMAEKKSLNAEQQAAVEALCNSTVSASAGSGKTTVLAERFIYLLNHPDVKKRAKPEEILCLTFTKKAAAEMQERIYQRLLATGHAGLDFNKTVIATLDAFCGSIVRSSAPSYGYTPDFLVATDTELLDLLRPLALNYLLARHRELGFQTLVTSLGFQTIWDDLLCSVALKFSDPALVGLGNIETSAAKAEKYLQEKIIECRQIITESHAAFIEQFTQLASPGKRANDAYEIIINCTDLGDLDQLATFAKIHTGFKKDEEELKILARTLKDNAAIYEPLLKTEREFPLHKASLDELSEFIEECITAKKQAGLMSFNDVAQCARDLLLRDAAVRNFWKGQFKYIMIDEFQDNNSLQRDLLFLLSEKNSTTLNYLPSAADLEPEKLFLVGDDKQSIYKFREADVSVFNKLRDEFSASAGNLNLRTNYRSNAQLVEFFNAMGEKIFAPVTKENEFNSEHKDYEARPSAARAGRPPRESDSELTPLQFYHYPYTAADSEAGEVSEDEESEDSTRDEEFARNVAKLIYDKVHKGKCTYDDIAVLLLNRNKQYILEKELRNYGITYTADTVCSFYFEAIVHDMFYMLKIALFPHDHYSYAIALHSSFAEISFASIAKLISTFPPEKDAAPTAQSRLTAFAPEHAGLLTQKEVTQWQNAANIYTYLVEHIDRSSIASLVSYLWEPMRKKIEQEKNSAVYLEHYDFLFKLASDADANGTNLVEFLRKMETFLGKSEKLDELEAVRENIGGVKLMTIHGSKGLEFPVVILPWFEATMRSNRKGASYYYNDSMGMSFNIKDLKPAAKAANIFYTLSKEEADAKDLAERKRLLYVACTRAKDELIFASCEPRTNNKSSLMTVLFDTVKPFKEDKEGALNIPPLLEKIMEQGIVQEFFKINESTHEQVTQSFIPRQPKAKIEMVTEAVTISATELGKKICSAAPAPWQGRALWDTSELDKILASEEGMSAQDFGTRCHKIIELSLKYEGSELKAALEALKVTQYDAVTNVLATKCSQKFAENFLNSALCAKIKSMQYQCEKELFLRTVKNDKTEFVKCRLDLWAESASEIIIIDFKSDQEIDLTHYAGQLALYREAAQKIASNKKVCSLLFALRYENPTGIEIV